MILENYLYILNEVKLPDELKTKSFIHKYSIDHSWYKHLPEEREAIFIFFINESGQWDYCSQMHSDKVDVPNEIKKMGTIKLSCFIYGKYIDSKDFYHKKTNLTYAEMHTAEVKDLENHLFNILEYLKKNII